MNKEKIEYIAAIESQILSCLVNELETEKRERNFLYASTRLTPADFITPTNKNLAFCIWEMQREGEDITVESLAMRTIDRGFGSTLAYDVARLIDCYHNAVGRLEKNIDTLVKESQTAQTLKNYENAIKQLKNGADPSEIAKQADSTNEEIFTKQAPTKSIKDIDATAELRAEFEKEGIAGIPTPWPKFDETNQGIQQNQFIIIAGRPGQGKTSLMLNMITKAIKDGKKILFFSLEMDASDLKKQLMQILSDTPRQLFKQKKALPLHFDRMAKAEEILNNSGLEVIDDIFDLAGIQFKISEFAKYGLDLVVIDYLQLCKPFEGKKYGNRQEAVSDISRELVLTKKKHRVPIIAGSQVGRPQNVSGVPPMPGLGSMRESGSIEQDANVVYAVQRPSYYLESDPEQYDALTIDEKQLMKVACLKYRGGETGLYRFRWFGAATKIQEWNDPAPDYMDNLPYDPPNNNDINNLPPADDSEDIPF